MHQRRASAHCTVDGQASMAQSFYVDKLPIYGAAFVDNDRVLLCGGGGASRTGLTNRIVCYDLSGRRSSKAAPDGSAPAIGRQVGELQLSGDEDAPMCIAVHGSSILSGINESAKARAASGDNCHLRTFKVSVPEDGSSDVSLQMALSHQVLDLNAERDDYQRQVSFGPDGRHAVVLSSEGRCAVVETAQMRKLPLATLDNPKRTTVDAVLLQDAVLAASERIVRYIPLSSDSKAVRDADTSLGDTETEIFKLDSVQMLAAYEVHRLGISRDGGGVCIAMNAAEAKRKESYVSLFNVSKGRLVQKDVDHYAKRVKDVYMGPSLPTPPLPKGISPTMAAVRDDIAVPKRPRQFMVFTFADGSVEVHGAEALRPLKSFAPGKLHSFPPAAVAFSPDGKTCLTASIDGKVNLIDLAAIDRAASSRPAKLSTFVVIFLIILILALYIQQR